MLKANRFLKNWYIFFGGLRKQGRSLSHQMLGPGTLKTSIFGIVWIIALILVGISSTEAQAQSIPTPEFFGVYALYDGKLTELKRHPQSGTYRNLFDGSKDEIKSLSNIKFPDSGKLTFIIFSPSVVNLTTNKFRVDVMATVRNAQPSSFYLTNMGWDFSVAPVPNQPQMVRLILKGGTAGGHLALMLDDGFYDYEITNQPPDKNYSCVERPNENILNNFLDSSYKPCRSGQPSNPMRNSLPNSNPTNPPPRTDNGGISPVKSSYTDNGNGTVTDKTTGLTWQKGENAAQFNWYQASGTYNEKVNATTQNVCGSLNLAGGGWRLPTKDELLGLVDESFKPMINATYFPNGYASYYWASNSYAYDNSPAWYVYFGSGASGTGAKSSPSYVRCVRGGQ